MTAGVCDKKMPLEIVETVLSERLARLGVRESGLFNFYAWKLQHQCLLYDYDQKAICLLQGMRGRYRRVWDIGAGIGQLSVALAADGWQVMAIDHSRLRFAALEAVIDSVGESWPEIGARIEPILGTFPDVIAEIDVSNDLAIAFGSTFTAPQATHQAFVDALHRFKAALIDFASLCTPTNDPVVWRGRAVAFSGRPDIVPVFCYDDYDRATKKDEVYGVYLVESQTL
jgi:SAM-dependent methyltransferase